jgi:crotonobetainyl-CoA:carnitine CoA-transferase CaiB-like acyl-CoA transferase
MEPSQARPLDDLRVLDLTVARAGPTCVRHLADWGADVVRIDAPPAGSGPARRDGDLQNLHRNKRSLTLDLKTPDGRAILGRLIDGADVLVENMRPGVKARLGFDWPAVHARNPRLVLGSISGFGQDGPYADRGGVDQIAQGMGGLMSVTGLPGTEPTRVGIPVSDLAAGLHLAIGILVALHDRARTGRGRWVRTSLLESMVAMMDFQAARWTVEGTVPVQEGNHHPTYLPMGCFRSKDGWVNVAGPWGRLLRSFCAVIGLPDLPSDPRFDTTAKRSATGEALNAIVAERLATRTTAEWVDALAAAGGAVRAGVRHGRGVRRSPGRAPGHGRHRRAPHAGTARHPAQRRHHDRRVSDGAYRQPRAGRAQRRRAGRDRPDRRRDRRSPPPPHHLNREETDARPRSGNRQAAGRRGRRRGPPDVQQPGQAQRSVGGDAGGAARRAAGVPG